MHASPESAHAMTLAGEPVWLLGARALYWPARARLVIADLHLGKSHAFRQAGIAVPSGATRADLARLDGLVQAWGARELWIVGDVLHGPAGDAAWRERWIEWRRAHATLDVVALPGNHDRALEGEALGLRQLGESATDGPFVFRHLPRPDAAGGHVIAGHVHPKLRLPGLARAAPGFWLREQLTVLPAFSEFTGGQPVQLAPGERFVACQDGGVLPWPPG